MNKDEKLKLLREVTKLDFISSYRIYRENKKAEYLRDMIAKGDPTHVYSVDYTKSNDLEYDIRMKMLMQQLYGAWKQYIIVENDGTALCDFAEWYLYNYKEKYEKGMTK